MKILAHSAFDHVAILGFPELSANATFHVGLVASFVLLLSALAETSNSQDAFTLVALPDTQNYVNSAENAMLFTEQTQWIADQVQMAGNPRNIQFVSHLGDVVSEGSELIQWQRAESSLDIIDGIVKYSILPGNHDYASASVKSSGTANYVDFFGPGRFLGKSWYGGADPSGNNSYQLFSAGGIEILHLALEWAPTINVPDREVSPIEWAQFVLDLHPSTPVIISTHEYVTEKPAGRSESGEELWDQLVRFNDQIFMVLNGHFHSFGKPFGGQHHQASMNNAGRPVFEVLQNYQDFPAGGEGWLRLIEFDVANDQLAFQTYSPVLDQFLETRVEDYGTFAGEFQFDIDFSDRLVPVASPSTGDFDFDSDIDGTDFLSWQRGGSPNPINSSDLEDWETAYQGIGSLATSSATVPEPAAQVLLLAWIMFVLPRPDHSY